MCVEFDHAAHQGHAIGQLLGAEGVDLVAVTRVGEGQAEGTGLHLVADRQHVGRRDVVHVRAVAVAPAGVEAHPLGRDAGQGLVQGGDVHLHRLDELRQRLVLEVAGALDAEVGQVDLQHVALGHDKLVFLPELAGQREDVGFVAVIVLVLQRAGGEAGRDGGDEGLGEALRLPLERAGEGVELGLGTIQALVAHRADRGREAVDVEPAHAARLVVLPPLGKVLHVEDRPALRLAAETRHAPGDVAEEGGARHLSVVADIDAAVELAAHDLVHRLVGQRRDARGIDRLALGLGHQQVGQKVWPRQAAHVGGQDAFRAAFHALRSPVWSKATSGGVEDANRREALCGRSFRSAHMQIPRRSETTPSAGSGPFRRRTRRM